MGFISMQEDVQESRDDYQRKLDRQKMAPLTDNQQATPQLLDEINRSIETLNQLIDLAADPEVRWAEKALALQAQLDRANYQIKSLKEEVESLRATLKQERDAHAAEIKRLREERGQKIKEYDKLLWRNFSQQMDEKHSTKHRNRRSCVKLQDRLPPDQKVKLRNWL
jgi:chromosome segregation ATPase